jgi:SAM-dependent methyltransferase
VDLRQRSQEPEILDGIHVAEDVQQRCYADLARTHRWLGNYTAILVRLRREAHPVNRVLDIGCSDGLLLAEIQAKLGVAVIGIDLIPPSRQPGVTIVRGDAVRDPLPAADVAIAVMMAHHLSAEELMRLIRNVGRVCRRFLILDLVRHWIPLLLFRAFLAPIVNPINAHDGVRSLERSFTPWELRRIVAEALAGSGAQFHQVVAPFYVRQIVDIRYSQY